jgi:hypothetical protein
MGPATLLPLSFLRFRSSSLGGHTPWGEQLLLRRTSQAPLDMQLQQRYRRWHQGRLRAPRRSSGSARKGRARGSSSSAVRNGHLPNVMSAIWPTADARQPLQCGTIDSAHPSGKPGKSTLSKRRSVANRLRATGTRTRRSVVFPCRRTTFLSHTEDGNRCVRTLKSRAQQNACRSWRRHRPRRSR